MTTNEVYDGVSYKIDEWSANLTVAVNCDYPCLTCPTGKSICASCLSTLTGVQLLKQETTCVDQCAWNYVNISNICEKCDDKCAACLVTNW